MSSRNLSTSFCDLFSRNLNFNTESSTSSSSSSSLVSSLPPPVLVEILLKLPIKSIIRCKSVSKSWRDLISDPDFASIYLKNPLFTVIVLSQHRIAVDRLDYGSFYFLVIGPDGDGVMRTPFNPRALSFPRLGLLSVTGSSNGLLCMFDCPLPVVRNRDISYNNQKVYIVNPLLGNFILLPKVKSWENISYVVYGFGLSVGGKYKVVRFVSRYVFHGSTEFDYKVHGEILTLGGVDGRWRWRYFEDSIIPFYLFPSGVTLNGILHWIGSDRLSGFVFAFDIDQEKGRRIQLPTGLRDDPSNIVLTVYDEKLCITDNSSEAQVDVWIMMRYGVKKSWKRKIILKNSIPSVNLRPCSFIPITTLRNGELLLSRRNEGDLSLTSGPNGQNMISFDPKTNTCCELVVSGGEGTVSFLFEYSPSFSSVGNG